MVLGLRHSVKGTRVGLGKSTQLDSQAAAVSAVAYTASGAIGPADNVVDLNKSDGILAMTIAGGFDVGRILVITQIDAGTEGHTVTLTPTGATFDGTNNTATFNAVIKFSEENLLNSGCHEFRQFASFEKYLL